MVLLAHMPVAVSGHTPLVASGVSAAIIEPWYCITIFISSVELCRMRAPVVKSSVASLPVSAAVPVGAPGMASGGVAISVVSGEFMPSVDL